MMMVVRSRASFFATTVIAAAEAALALVILPELPRHRALACAAVAVVILLLVAYAELVRNSRTIELDLARSCLIERQRSWRLGWRRQEYALARFASVLSFTTPFRHPREHVELVTHAGGEALLITDFPAASAQPSPFGQALAHESEPCRMLRCSLAEHLRLRDGGFLGYRWPGAYVTPDKVRHDRTFGTRG